MSDRIAEYSRRLKATSEPPVARRSPRSAAPGPLTLIDWLAMVHRCLTVSQEKRAVPAPLKCVLEAT